MLHQLIRMGSHTDEGVKTITKKEERDEQEIKKQNYLSQLLNRNLKRKHQKKAKVEKRPGKKTSTIFFFLASVKT